MTAGRTIDGMLPASVGLLGRNDTRRQAVPPVPVPLVLSIVRCADVGAIFAAGLVTMAAMPALGVQVDWHPQLLVATVATAISGCVLGAMNAYSVKQLMSLRRRISTRALATLAGFPAILFCLALIPGAHAMLPAWPVTWVVCAFLAQSAGHAALAFAVRRWVANGQLSRRVVVVGLNDFSAGFLGRVAHQSDSGLDVIGLYRDEVDPPGTEHAGHRVLGSIEEIVTRGRRERIDAVVLAIPLTQPERIASARRVLSSMVAEVYLTAGLAGLQFELREMMDFASTPMVKVGTRPLSPAQALQKSIMDWVCSFALLTLLGPLLAVIALLIKIDSPGPVLFCQPRLGFNNVLYTVFKFRTMHHGAADLMADRQTTRGDPRITRVGAILRRFSLDELPQLLNVLGGSMSLVGPRPHALNTKAGDTLFHDAVADYALRHRVKPGITGWAQVNGWRGETKTVDQIEQRVQHDLYYIDHWSLMFDLRIMLLTVMREINSKTAF